HIFTGAFCTSAAICARAFTSLLCVLIPFFVCVCTIFPLVRFHNILRAATFESFKPGANGDGVGDAPCTHDFGKLVCPDREISVESNPSRPHRNWQALPLRNAVADGSWLNDLSHFWPREV